jgi:hypothetical protein
MGIYRGESCCPDQTLVATHGDVLLGMRVHISLGEAKVDCVYFVRSLGCSPDEEVIRFYIPMDESSLVDTLHSL